MIAIFDEDGGGDVDFQEFVSGLSAFSSKGNKEEKLRFAFKVYDIDRDGYISNGELFIVLKMMVGSNLKDVQLQQVSRQCNRSFSDLSLFSLVSSPRFWAAGSKLATTPFGSLCSNIVCGYRIKQCHTKGYSCRLWTRPLWRRI